MATITPAVIPTTSSPQESEQITTAHFSILRLPKVMERTGLSRATIYLRIADGLFPRPISLGGRAVGWVASEIDDWIQVQIKSSRSATVSGQEER